MVLIASAKDAFDGYQHLLTTPKNYIVYRANSAMAIDGKAEEDSWKNAQWSETFIDIEGDKKPLPTHKTRFKMLWDETNLYILAEMVEPQVWAYYATRDQIVYHENDFEVFIDPDRDTHNYFEFEVNAQNTMFDLFMKKPYRNGGNYDIGWDAVGLKSAVVVEGTVNHPADIDQKWTVEMAIPFSSLKVAGNFIVPKNGDCWKINFSRVQWQTEVVDGKYQKVKDPKTNEFLPENNWVWSEQGVINMHFPERWGFACFSTQPANENHGDFTVPEEEILGKYLWLLYYKQHSYQEKNRKYASSLAELGMDDLTATKKGESMSLKMEKTDSGFDGFLENKKWKLTINQDGFFEKMKHN